MRLAVKKRKPTPTPLPMCFTDTSVINRNVLFYFDATEKTLFICPSATLFKMPWFGLFIEADFPFKPHFCQSAVHWFNPHPLRYCQQRSISNYSIKARPVDCRLRRMMSMIAAREGQRYEWFVGRNVQFTAVWDFHLSSAQWWKAGVSMKKK